MLDTEKKSIEEIMAEQTEIISGVVTGIISKAVRETEQNDLIIHKDDYIGFVGDDIYIDETDKNEALKALAKKLSIGSYDIALIICGESVTPDESEEIYSSLTKLYPFTEIIMIDGKQPIYDYIITLE